ncbi:type II secretion system secretin GspD [Metallibacterium sp.]|uniref:type II secretion system secretin GspD n=1 Tax=Metallibacterium sp. TaxID=2940281 RepID=UPI0026147353|nr:type II secretion system secretin GspD [Metallibacterium sp.]
MKRTPPVLSHLLLLALGLLLSRNVIAQQDAPPPPLASAAAQDVTLNLRNVDIRTLIDTVSKATGINFVVDPRVRGNVTVVSSTPMDRDALYQVFLSVLEVYGYAAVPSGPVVKIVPSINARQTLQLHGQGEALITRVIHVSTVPVAQLLPLLRPLLPPQAVLSAYPPGNVLIVTDRAADIDGIVKLVRQLDNPANGGVSIVQLRYASAEQVARTLNALQSSAAGEGGMPPVPVVADARSNSILIAGDPAAQARMRALIQQLDVSLPAAGNSQVIFLRYAKAEAMAKLLQQVVQTQEKTSEKAKSAPESPINIQADVTNNALIITGPPDRVRDLQQLVRQLDVRPKEVLIDAIIAEVSGDLSRQLGAQIAVLPSVGSTQNPVAVSNFTNGALPLATLAGGASAIGQALAASPGVFLGFGSNRSGQARYGLLLNALQSNSATNILSTPSLMTLDNKQAEIVVGQDVPFVTGSYSTTLNQGGGGTVTSPFQTIERKKVGITLKVTPQINEGDSVRLKLELTVSSIAPSISGAVDLITNTRQVKTVVITDNGAIVVLGGLIQDSYTNSVQKVPLLGSLPFIGRLFSSTSRQLQKQNLMIFLHPVIIDTQNAANAYTAEKYRILRQQSARAANNRNSMQQQPLPTHLRQFVPAPASSGVAPATAVSVAPAPAASVGARSAPLLAPAAAASAPAPARGTHGG